MKRTIKVDRQLFEATKGTAMRINAMSVVLSDLFARLHLSSEAEMKREYFHMAEMISMQAKEIINAHTQVEHKERFLAQRKERLKNEAKGRHEGEPR
ncbi:hypothetical protein ACO34A_13085 [Rhizobium sp. ACO-34A]|nr:hypothetical protein [Rhizobium sp. ACO-34A]ATN34734.1 hypothetical protein ACO34A_13085 [Rhizobium sp. ACO-34A]